MRPSRRAPAVLGEPMPTGSVVVALHQSRRGDLAVARECLSDGRGVYLVHPDRRPSRAHAEAVEHLRGGVVVICPEGDRAWGDHIGRLDVEVARLALDGRAPVVPAWVEGDRLALGPALDFSRHVNTPHSHAVLRAVSDEVAEALCRLTGMPYRDEPLGAGHGRLLHRWLRRRQERRWDRRQTEEAERRARDDAARVAADLARDEERARRAAQLQARRAALADRLEDHEIHPGTGRRSER